MSLPPYNDLQPLTHVPVRSALAESVTEPHHSTIVLDLSDRFTASQLETLTKQIQDYAQICCLLQTVQTQLLVNTTATPASVDVQMLLQRQCSQQQQQQQQQLASLQQLLAAQPSSSAAGQPQLPHDQATPQFNRAATPLESADLDAADLANKRQKATPRWSPTQTQLQALEVLFATGEGTPSKPRIKEITDQLMEFGPITEPSVYNWFQNRKARAKKRGHLQPDSEGVSAQEESASNTAADITVDINQKLWGVNGGMLDVRSTFGDNMVLYDDKGNVVPLSDKGIVLEPVVNGAVYIAKVPAEA